MKKLVFTIISLLLSSLAFCQRNFLHLKANDTIMFQSWDTLFASFRNDKVVITDKEGVEHQFVLDKNGYGPFFSDMVISEGGKYHSCGDYRKKRRCHKGVIFMDENMRLFFRDKSKAYNSSHYDHGSHMSHFSSNVY